uniref:Ankyrin repeat protein n=1 Tax=Pithovirus LCPAC001 TaxID=2506585 RepID=A0A481Z4R4_9VIRU|nr:MAG: ankyrin repeat protein [Pithovirus LCPAC001]
MSTSAQTAKLVTRAIKKGNNKVVQYFLDHSDYDPSADYNDAIKLASQKGFVKIVKLLLLDKRVNPGSHNNCALKLASKNGHLEVVKELLKDPRIDYDNDPPTKLVWINEAIKLTVANGHSEVVKLLEEYLKSKKSIPQLKKIVINIPIELKNTVEINYV